MVLVSTGEAPSTVRYRPGEALLWLYRRFGPVVRAGPYTYLLGPEANRFVFANSHLFRWREAFQTLTPVDGETSLIVSDGAEHRRRRRLVQPAMRHRQVGGYLRIMAENADRVIDSWQPGQTIDIYQQLRAAIRRSTIHSLFGARIAEDAAFFGAELQHLLDLIDRLPQSVVVHQRLRTPLWRRAMTARSRIDQRLYAEITRARRSSADADDHALATLVQGMDDDGERLTDTEVRDQVISLIAAGYETTSAAMSWAVYYLLTTPGWWQTAAAEVSDVAGDSPPAPVDLKQLIYLNGVVQETLRLHPPGAVSPRYVVKGFTFAGKRIRPGRLLLYSPYVTHRLAELWPDPLSFEPRRWDPAFDGHRKPGPHEYLPFGGGPHRCIGSTMATTEMLVMLARLLSRTTISLVPQRIRATSPAAMRPRGGLHVEIRHS